MAIDRLLEKDRTKSTEKNKQRNHQDHNYDEDDVKENDNEYQAKSKPPSNRKKYVTSQLEHKLPSEAHEHDQQDTNKSSASLSNPRGSEKRPQAGASHLRVPTFGQVSPLIRGASLSTSTSPSSSSSQLSSSSTSVRLLSPKDTHNKRVLFGPASSHQAKPREYSNISNIYPTLSVGSMRLANDAIGGRTTKQNLQSKSNLNSHSQSHLNTGSSITREPAQIRPRERPASVAGAIHNQKSTSTWTRSAERAPLTPPAPRRTNFAAERLWQATPATDPDCPLHGHPRGDNPSMRPLRGYAHAEAGAREVATSPYASRHSDSLLQNSFGGMTLGAGGGADDAGHHRTRSYDIDNEFDDDDHVHHVRHDINNDLDNEQDLQDSNSINEGHMGTPRARFVTTRPSSYHHNHSNQEPGNRGAAHYASAYSLESPASPPSGIRTSLSHAHEPAYYDRPSRFTMFGSARNLSQPQQQPHPPQQQAKRLAPDLRRPKLAPPMEQVRRLIVHGAGGIREAQHRPLYLHPQWAYSRPFRHLLPASASWWPISGALELPDDPETIGYADQDSQGRVPRVQFRPFSQLEDSQAIRAVDFHPSGQVYAVGSNSRALRICAYPTPDELASTSPGFPPVGATQDRQASGASVSATATTTTRLRPTPVLGSPRVLFKFLQVHRGSIYCVRFNSTGRLLATGSNDQTVHIVKYNSRLHSPEGDEFRLTMHAGTVRDLCFVDDNSNSAQKAEASGSGQLGGEGATGGAPMSSGSSLLLSAGGGDNKIYVTDCDTITPFQSFAGHSQAVMSLWHLGGAQFVSGSHDRTIRFWDLRARHCTAIVSAPDVGASTQGLHGTTGFGAGGRLAGPGAPVNSLVSDPSGRLLVSGHSDGSCMLYDTRGGRIIQAFQSHQDEIRSLSLSAKSMYLLSGSYDGRLVVYDLQGDLNQTLPSVCVANQPDKIIQTRWHPTDFTFVATSANKTATLWVPPSD